MNAAAALPQQMPVQPRGGGRFEPAAMLRDMPALTDPSLTWNGLMAHMVRPHFTFETAERHGLLTLVNDDEAELHDQSAESNAVLMDSIDADSDLSSGNVSSSISLGSSHVSGNPEIRAAASLGLQNEVNQKINPAAEKLIQHREAESVAAQDIAQRHPDLPVAEAAAGRVFGESFSALNGRAQPHDGTVEQTGWRARHGHAQVALGEDLNEHVHASSTSPEMRPPQGVGYSKRISSGLPGMLDQAGGEGHATGTHEGARLPVQEAAAEAVEREWKAEIKPARAHQMQSPDAKAAADESGVVRQPGLPLVEAAGGVLRRHSPLDHATELDGTHLLMGAMAPAGLDPRPGDAETAVGRDSTGHITALPPMPERAPTERQPGILDRLPAEVLATVTQPSSELPIHEEAAPQALNAERNRVRARILDSEGTRSINQPARPQRMDGQSALSRSAAPVTVSPVAQLSQAVPPTHLERSMFDEQSAGDKDVEARIERLRHKPGALEALQDEQPPALIAKELNPSSHRDHGKPQPAELANSVRPKIDKDRPSVQSDPQARAEDPPRKKLSGMEERSAQANKRTQSHFAGSSQPASIDLQQPFRNMVDADASEVQFGNQVSGRMVPAFDHDLRTASQRKTFAVERVSDSRDIAPTPATKRVADGSLGDEWKQSTAFAPQMAGETSWSSQSQPTPLAKVVSPAKETAPGGKVRPMISHEAYHPGNRVSGSAGPDMVRLQESEGVAAAPAQHAVRGMVGSAQWGKEAGGLTSQRRDRAFHGNPAAGKPAAEDASRPGSERFSEKYLGDAATAPISPADTVQDDMQAHTLSGPASSSFNIHVDRIQIASERPALKARPFRRAQPRMSLANYRAMD